MRSCTTGQAGADVGASSRLARAGVRRRSETEKPAMSSDVMSAPDTQRATTRPRAVRLPESSQKSLPCSIYSVKLTV